MDLDNRRLEFKASQPRVGWLFYPQKHDVVIGKPEVIPLEPLQKKTIIPSVVFKTTPKKCNEPECFIKNLNN